MARAVTLPCLDCGAAIEAPRFLGGGHDVMCRCGLIYAADLLRRVDRDKWLRALACTCPGMVVRDQHDTMTITTHSCVEGMV